jgi:hypothetical protein
MFTLSQGRQLFPTIWSRSCPLCSATETKEDQIRFKDCARWHSVQMNCWNIDLNQKELFYIERVLNDWNKVPLEVKKAQDKANNFQNLP